MARLQTHYEIGGIRLTAWEVIATVYEAGQIRKALQGAQNHTGAFGSFERRHGEGEATITTPDGNTYTVIPTHVGFVVRNYVFPELEGLGRTVEDAARMLILEVNA
ncbi:hypothetical protein [Rhizobium phage RHph_X2_26]|nr:hypothetical protein [Rhizobium phage RHph_X2_26]